MCGTRNLSTFQINSTRSPVITDNVLPMNDEIDIIIPNDAQISLIAPSASFSLPRSKRISAQNYRRLNKVAHELF